MRRTRTHWGAPPDRLQDVISSLEAFTDECRLDQTVPGATVLLNLGHTLPERRRGMFDLDAGMVVGRVVYRLVRALETPDIIEQAVESVLPELHAFSSKMELIAIVGHQEGAGHALVSKAAAERFERDLREEIRSAPVERLSADPDLFRLLWFVHKASAPEEPALIIPGSPAITLAILRSSRSEMRSQSFDSRAVRRTTRLAWESLTELYGGEDILRTRIEELKIALPEADASLLEVADKHLNGWRPDIRRDED
jgi:hypothetical protein